jgi:citrate lyase subunit beta/citryl-CoA lyase
VVSDVPASSEHRTTELWVRINPISSAHALADLVAVAVPGLSGVLLPKVEKAADVTRLCHYLGALEATADMADGSVRIAIVATETPQIMFGLGDLAGSSPRLRACTWGAEDLSTALGATTNKRADGGWDDPYLLAQSLCLYASAAASVQPVDTLFAAFRDDEGLVRSTQLSRRRGFTGKIAIHPCQVPIINEHMTPSADEVAEAERVVAAFAANADAGTVSLEGRMLDRPHLVNAERVLARAGRRFADVDAR